VFSSFFSIPVAGCHHLHVLSSFTSKQKTVMEITCFVPFPNGQFSKVKSASMLSVSNLTACLNRDQGWLGSAEDILFHSGGLPLKVMWDYIQKIM